MSFSTSERFTALDPKDLDRLEALAKLDEFAAGQEILVSGQPAGDEEERRHSWLYLIASGTVDVRAKTPSGDTTLVELQAGDLFGELESFCELPEGVRHVARTATICRVIPKNPLLQELKAHRSLATGLLSVYCKSISGKIRATNDVAVRMGPAGGNLLSRPPPPASAAGGRPPHLSEAEAAWMRVLGSEVALPSGTVAVEEGDTTRAFFVIDEGTCAVRKRIGGDSRTLATLSALDMFGFMAFVDGKPRSASVVAASDVRLSRIESDVLDKALHLNFTVAFKFLGTLCGVLGRTYRDTVRAVIASS